MGAFGDKLVGSGEGFNRLVGGDKKKDKKKKPFKSEEHGALGVLLHELRGEKGQKIKRELSKLGGRAKGQITELKEFTDDAIAIHKGKARVVEKADPKEEFEDWSKALSKALEDKDWKTYNSLLEEAERKKVKLKDLT